MLEDATIDGHDLLWSDRDGNGVVGRRRNRRSDGERDLIGFLRKGPRRAIGQAAKSCDSC